MITYRCAYCHKDLGVDPSARCPHCGRAMLMPRRDKKKRPASSSRDADENPLPGIPIFRPGKNPAILGAFILGFIVLGTLLTSRMTPPSDTQTLQTDPVARAMREVDTLIAALDRFQSDTGRYPSAKEGLVALVRNPEAPGWNGHYVNLIQPDPWRTPYLYTETPDGPEVRSAGPDRTFGSPDDIFSQCKP